MKTLQKALVVFAVLALASCISHGTKVRQDDLSQFVKGKTTSAEIIQQLGTPTQSIMNTDGTKMISYTYMQSQSNVATFIPIVGLFVGGTESENTSVVLYFDKNNLLTGYSASEGGGDMGTGIFSGQKQ